jgi:hypothetical protein
MRSELLRITLELEKAWLAWPRSPQAEYDRLRVIEARLHELGADLE